MSAPVRIQRPITSLYSTKGKKVALNCARSLMRAKKPWALTPVMSEWIYSQSPLKIWHVFSWTELKQVLALTQIYFSLLSIYLLHLYLFIGFYFLLRDFIFYLEAPFLEQFLVYNKIERKVERSPMYPLPLPTHAQPPQLSTSLTRMILFPPHQE